MSTIASEYKLENYRIVSQLNHSGNLWLVLDQVTEKQFVMRKLPLAGASVFEQLRQISHPNIVGIIDVFCVGDSCYVIEEYLEGGCLCGLTIVNRKRLMAIAKQVLSALQTLHNNGIIHRDLKPGNIMLDKSGTVKLIDFHISRLFAEDKERDTTVKGSGAYAPPEQFGFSQTDFRSDIYSFGVTLNELATGKLPEDELCKGDLGKVVLRCTELDPKRRYQSCGQALAHLNQMERRPRLCALAAVLLVAGLLCGRMVTMPPQGAFEAELADRIVRVRDDESYPAILLEEDDTKSVAIDLGDEAQTYVQLARTGDILNLNITARGRADAHLQFEDDLESKEESNIALSYEVLFHDIDQNGVDDLLVSLSRRKRIATPDIQNRYYLTEYSQTWVVSKTEQGFVQSQPLFVEQTAPVLDGEEAIRDSLSNTWYGFRGGEWTYLN